MVDFSFLKKNAESFYKNASVIGNIESAYIVSRYYPIWFEEVEVKEMLETFEEFQEVLRQCL